MNNKNKNKNILGAVSVLISAVIFMTTLSGCSLDKLFSNIGHIFSEETTQETTVPQTTSESEKKAVVSTYGYDNISNDTSRNLYQTINNHINDIKALEITYPGNLTYLEVGEAIEAFKLDHPECFWLKNGFQFVDNEDYDCVTFRYSYENDDLINAKSKFDTAIQNFMDKAPVKSSDYEKELYANNFLVKNVVYDDKATEKDEDSNNNAYSAYGALVDGNAVCEGYSKAFQLLCEKLGIECVCVCGNAQDELHEWNCVKIDGEWYQTDVTWNDSSHEYLVNCYLNLTDEQMYGDHKIDPYFSEVSEKDYSENNNLMCNLYVPKCTSTKYNYYRNCDNSFVLKDFDSDKDDFTSAIAKSASNKEKLFYVICDNLSEYDSVYDKLVNTTYLSECFRDANYINNYSEELSSTCQVYSEEKIGVVIAELSYE